MIIPFKPEELFELNDNLVTKRVGDVVIINNVFKNYDKILEVLTNIPVEVWKMDNDTRNFVDYYDCRPLFKNHFPTELTDKRYLTLGKILCDEFNENISSLRVDLEFIFNYFKHITKGVPKTQQHRPHCDEYYNVISYLDKHNNGGTVIYHDIDVNGNEIQNEGQFEGTNLFTDVSHLRIKQFIEATPNSMAIFPGHLLHGAWINDHSIYEDEWRINLVHFFKHKDGERI